VRTFLQSTAVFTVVGSGILALAMMQASSPVSASSKAQVRGAALFATSGCVHCHGPAGVGGKNGPDLQLVRKRLNKAQMRLRIHNGGLTMPAFGDSLTSPQIDDLIAYLRAKRKVIVVTAKPSATASEPIGSTPDPN
jgi:mono/diheme cytochrome c family protein